MANVFFPGTFDPVTKGHEDLIHRCVGLFSHLTVALTTNPEKTPLLSINDRIELLQQSCKGTHVTIEVFDGLLVDYVSSVKNPLIVRGVRSINDYIYEHDRAMMNQSLSHNLETIFLPSKPEFSSLSSTLVREIARLGGDLSSFVSPHVQEKLKHHGSQNNR